MIVAGIFGAAATVFGSPDFLRAVTATFTFANTMILVWHARRVKTEIMPKVDRIETVADAIDPRIDGGRRATDPCPVPEDLQGFKYSHGGRTMRGKPRGNR